jgi:uncharacterized protein with ParB-like and HNH nuclease domain
MTELQSYLHTTHRTVNWFKKAHQNDELQLSAPFQRNPVWTNAQKSYLIDTILQGLPVPEFYMQDAVSDEGEERNLVVDGQQRVRACLDFVFGEYALEGEDVDARWRELTFDELEPGEKKSIYGYKFVVRVLPSMPEEELRRIFARLNRNVVALNQQELRNATYWGPFISLVQSMADDDPFWADAGIFSSNDHRRMLDHEFLSELMIAFLHGRQNKKDKLDHYYQLYEEEFEQEEEVAQKFSRTTAEIAQILPTLRGTRWRKKSDFYTLFLSLVERVDEFPFSSDQREEVGRSILDLGHEVDAVLKLDDEEWGNADKRAVKYARSVTAASDKASRTARSEALEEFVFGTTPAG